MEAQTKSLLKYLILPLLLLTVVLIVADRQTRPDFLLHAHVYNFDGSRATLIQTYLNRKILVDGGPTDAILENLGRDLPFYDRSIDLLVLTKPDASHTAGVVAVLKRYQVKMVLVPPSDVNLAVYWEFLRLVDEKHIQKIFAKEGQRLWLDPATIFDVHAATGQIVGQLNFGKTQIALPSPSSNSSELVSDGTSLYKN